MTFHLGNGKQLLPLQCVCVCVCVCNTLLHGLFLLRKAFKLNISVWNL